MSDSITASEVVATRIERLAAIRKTIADAKRQLRMDNLADAMTELVDLLAELVA